MIDTKFRSIIKAVSWRIIATSITFLIAYIITKGNLAAAIGIGFADLIAKIAAYYFHERLWGIIKLGKKIHPLEDIKLKRELEKEDKELIREKLKELGYLDD